MRSVLSFIRLAIALELAFWVVVALAGLYAALITLFALTLIQQVMSFLNRRPGPAQAEAEKEVAGQLARELANRSTDPVQATMNDLAAQASVPSVHASVGNETNSKYTSGAYTAWIGGIVSVRVSPELAQGDPRVLRAVLAHELWHASRPPQLIVRLTKILAMPLVVIAYIAAVLAIPALLAVPKLVVLEIGGIIYLLVMIWFDERAADRYSVSLTKDPGSLLGHLESSPLGPIGRFVHRSRYTALRAMAQSPRDRP
jgi:Zn-dependent protease with chaperone function